MFNRLLSALAVPCLIPPRHRRTRPDLAFVTLEVALNECPIGCYQPLPIPAVGCNTQPAPNRAVPDHAIPSRNTRRMTVTNHLSAVVSPCPSPPVQGWPSLCWPCPTEPRCINLINQLQSATHCTHILSCLAIPFERKLC